MLSLRMPSPCQETDQPDDVSWAIEAAWGSLAGETGFQTTTKVPVPGQRPDPLQQTRPAPVPVGTVHSLGSLMQTIGSAVRVIEARLDPVAKADLRPVTTGASAAVHQATALVRELLELSHSRSALREILDVGAILREMDELIRLTAGRSVQIEFHIHDDVPVITCSRSEFEIAILNLIADARDRISSGGLLKVSVYRESVTADDDDEGLANAVLRVTDNGCGTSAAIAGLVFRPFFTSMAPGKGNGLGLAVVSEFARNLGGSAEIQTSVGQGTSVVLRLPGRADSLGISPCSGLLVRQRVAGQAGQERRLSATQS